jgi:hypothetical protein
MMPIRRRPRNSMLTSLPRPGHGWAVAKTRCGRSSDDAGPLADATRTQRNLRCYPACCSNSPDQGGLEGAAVIVIHSEAIQSP